MRLPFFLLTVWCKFLFRENPIRQTVEPQASEKMRIMRSRADRQARMVRRKEVLGSRFAPWTACAALFALLALSPFAGKAGEDSGLYPGKLGIAKAKGLTPQEREIEARFAKYLEEHTDEAIAGYRAKYGKEINTDNARELSQDYAPGGMEADEIGRAHV